MIKELLHSNDLRFTPCRSDMIELFQKKKLALSEPEIEKIFKDRYDRVTLYRNLATFVEKGLLHKVMDDTGAKRYALSSEDCSLNTIHQHNHVHFKCCQCGEVRCLEEITLPEPKLPSGYCMDEMHILLSGTCPNCI